MVSLIYIPGIGSHPWSDDYSRPAWTEALATGMEAAGHSNLARMLRRNAPIFPELAYYADLFGRPGVQGLLAEPIDEDEAALLCALLDELTARMTDQATSPAEKVRLQAVRAQLDPTKQAQGLGLQVRRVLNAATALFDVRPFRRAGQWVSAQVMIGDLRQVTRYLRRGESDQQNRTLDARIRGRIALHFKHQPTLILAHSLGSVIAYETLHENNLPVPLFMTFGSPLAMRTVVLPRLRPPQPPITPENVGKWINIWDKDDVIIVRPNLKQVIGPNRRGITPDSRRVDSDGAWVHTATKYLAHPNWLGQSPRRSSNLCL